MSQGLLRCHHDPSAACFFSEPAAQTLGYCTHQKDARLFRSDAPWQAMWESHSERCKLLSIQMKPLFGSYSPLVKGFLLGPVSSVPGQYTSMLVNNFSWPGWLGSRSVDFLVAS